MGTTITFYRGCLIFHDTEGRICAEFAEQYFASVAGAKAWVDEQYQNGHVRTDEPEAEERHFCSRYADFDDDAGAYFCRVCQQLLTSNFQS